MPRESNWYPPEIDLPDQETEYGGISFDFFEDLDSFLIVFSSSVAAEDKSFIEGDVYIKTNPDDFEIYVAKLRQIILDKILRIVKYKNGVEIQKDILTQLRLNFRKVSVDQNFQSALES